jgi:hypothetical protein
MVSKEKSDVIFIPVPLHSRYFPSMACFKIFSLSLVSCSLNMIS